MNEGMLQWYALAAVIIGALVRAIKAGDDLPVLRWIQPRQRPYVALALGVVSGVLESLATGVPMRDALLVGGASALTAMLGHDVGIEWLRKGRELTLPKLPPAAMFCLALLATPSCASARDTAILAANGSADVADVSIGVVEDLYRAEREACFVEHAGAAVACDDAVKLRYAKVFAAHRAFRAAWLALELAIKAGEGDASLAKLAADMQGALTAFAAAVREMKGGAR